MTSPNILLTRIDNRLVHGQVGVTWTSTIGANLLVVVDDVVANDDIQQKLMGITAETYGFGIRFFTIEKTINVIGKAAPHQKIFLICRTPQTVRKLVEGGGNDSNLLIVFYVQIMPDDFVMQLHRF
ncbi:hypothetical protein VEE17_05650 [Escherichia coli]|nr:hypothetical protein VEE41_27510 [Escherichia coli]BEB61240.1 hypothetical protein VEE17_05650 [Escherichia coli]